jgi:prohibitin 1
MEMFKIVKRGIITVAIVVVGTIGWFSFTETIPQGHAGVVYNRSHGVEEQTLSQGLKFVNPMERITAYPVSTETVEYKDVSLATKDGKPLSVTLTYDYLNDVEKLPYIYNKFKGQSPDAIEDTWLKARLRDSALKVTSQYTILEVFQSREKIQTEIRETFTKDVKKHGFIIDNVVFGTPVADEATAKAIQAVVDKQQELEALKIDQQKATVQAETQKIQAQGTAEAEIEKAKGTAQANKLLQQSITEELIKMKEAEARLKHGWVTTQGVGSAIVDTK